MPPDSDDPLAPLRRDPGRTGVFCDFDGTLSPIVADPSAAVPLAGAAETLDRLTEVYRLVAVVSGRPVAFLVGRLPSTVLLSGLYGLETVRAGTHVEDPAAGRWRDVVATAASRCAADVPDGVVVEPKGLSLTIHYRRVPDREPAVEALAAAVAADTGLVVRTARRSIELHPPVDADKGTVINTLAEGLDAACYLGDDLGDLAAFAALDQLAVRGVATVRVAVRSDEAPPELLEAADVVVDGPRGALALLRTLLPSS